MENLSFKEKGKVDLTVESLSVAIWEWINNDNNPEIRDSVNKLAKLSGVSARTIDSIKDYKGSSKKPDPKLSTMQKIADATRSRLSINKKYNSE